MSRHGPYDLLLDGVGFVVPIGADGKPRWAVRSISAEQGQVASIEDLPVTWKTWHLGYGYGESHVDGCYHYAEGIDARWPGLLIMAPLVTTVSLTADGTNRVSGIFEQVSGASTYLYVLHGRYCSRINLTDDTEVAIPSGAGGADGRDFGSSTVSTKAVNFQDNASAAMTYVGFSGTTNVFEFSGTAWTQATDDVDALYWCRDWSDAALNYRLWRAYGTNSVATCAAGDDPLAAASWSTAWAVGDLSSSLTGMIAADYNQVFVAKRDGLYRLDPTGRNANVFEQVGFLKDVDNGVNLLWANGRVYYPHMMGLLAYEPSSGETPSVQPGDKTSNRSAVRGIITAQAAAGPWHYVALYNGTDTYLLAGRYPTPGESLPPGWVGPKIWHPLAKLSAVRCDAMHFSGLTSPPRLWFGHGTNVAYIRLPKGGDVISELDASTLTFQTSGSIWFSPHDWGVPGAAKELIGFDIECSNISSSTYVDLYIRLDRGGWQNWGRAQVTGRSTLYLPSGDWRGHQIEMRLDVTSASSTSTPQIKPIVGKASIRPRRRKLVTTTVYCMDGLHLRNGEIERRKTGQILLDHLRNLEEGGPITVTDWWTGRSREQTATVHNVQETMIEQRGDDPAGYGADVTFSTIDAQPVPWSWDDGTIWDGAARWG